MSTQELKGVVRKGANKGVARRLRVSGQIPAVCYGKGLDSIAFAVDPAELAKVLSGPFGPNVVFNLVLDDAGKAITRSVMVKSLQREPVSRRVIHADLYAIDPTRKVVVEVPIVLEGRSVGVAQGGKLRQVTRGVNVRCLPADIPVEVKYDVSALDIKQRAQVSQITVPENLELVYHTDFAIAQILPPSKSGN